MKYLGRIMLLFVCIADGWFAWNTRAMFYTDAMAFKVAQDNIEIDTFADYLSVDLDTMTMEVRYDGLTFLDRVKRWRIMYDERTLFFPMRTFLWQFSNEESVMTLYISLAPNGSPVGTHQFSDRVFKEYPLYEH